MIQPSRNRLIQVVLMIAVVFGLIVGLIAFLLNILMKVGDGLSVALISMLSASIAFIIVLWIIQRGFKKFTNNNTENLFNQTNFNQNFFDQNQNK